MAKLKTKKRKEYVLPSEFSEPKENLSDYSLWIYGPPGIGKTTLSQMFEDIIHIMGEAGTKALRVRAVHPRSVKEFQGYISAFEDSREFSNGAVDTVESIYELYHAAAAKSLGFEHPSDIPYGKGWDAIKRPWMRDFKRFLRIPDKGSLLISHATSGSRKTGDGDEIEDIHPNLSGKPLAELSGEVDVLGYYALRKGKPTLQIRQSDEVMAKCRIEENFRYSDGSPITFIPMGRSKEEAFENLMAAFNNELPPPENDSSKTKKKGGSKFKLKRKK